MADTFPNPLHYTSPLGEAFGNLTRTILSGPSQAERIAAAEKALKAQREREGTGKLSQIFQHYADGFTPGDAASSALNAGYDPADLGEMTRFLAANVHGAKSPLTDNASVGAGGAYSSTFGGFSTDQGNQMARHAATLAEGARQFDQTPFEMLVDGKPMIGTNKSAIGGVPILSETDQKGTSLGNAWGNLAALPIEEQRVLGAAPTASTGAPFNYVVDGKNHLTTDGRTDAQTGLPLPPGGVKTGVEAANANDAGLNKTVVSGLQGENIANKKFSALLDHAEKQIMASPPENFGASGAIKGFAQNASILAGNIANGIGFPQVEDALVSLRDDAIKNGVNSSIISGIFDPRLGKLHTTYGMLIYSAASALAGQEGRSASDADVERIAAMVGDPQSFFSNQPTMLSKLQELRELLNIQQNVVDQNLGGAPAAAPLAAPTADGIPTIATPEEAMALPSGTKFKTPDGRIKVRP